jgi:hypothetical protein
MIKFVNNRLGAMLVIAMTVAIGSLSTPLSASAQAKDDRGYVDISQVEAWFDEEPTIEVNIRGALLNLVAEATKYEDPELSDMLHRLKMIQIRGFEMRGGRNELRTRSADLGKRLEAMGWETVVRVRDDEEHVQMYMLMSGDSIDGMVVLAMDDRDAEAVFVNIVGEIKPDQVGRIGRKFNIGALENN